MIQANDLMIGDRIRFKYLPRHDDEIFDGVVNSQMFLYPSDFEIIPIPLTEEILEKNGFIGIMGGNGIEYTSEEFKLRVIYRINNEGWTIYANHFGFDKKDLYVHKLQHALRLCGIEKEIEL